MRTFRVDYQAGAHDGLLLLRTALTETGSVATQATDVLEKQGIRAQVRRIVPIVN